MTTAPVDRIAMLGMALHAGADTAPEIVVGLGIGPGLARHKGRHIGEHPRPRVLLRQDMVQLGALVIVEVRRLGVLGVKTPRQLQHVVAVAALAGLVGDVFRDRIGRLEILPVAIAADHIAVMAGDRGPKRLRGLGVAGIAGDLVKTRQADQLRDLGVGVKVGEVVLPRLQGIEYLAIV